jgi:hypothetical protein
MLIRVADYKNPKNFNRKGRKERKGLKLKQTGISFFESLFLATLATLAVKIL